MAAKTRQFKDKRRYVRAIDELGRVVVPVEFRRRFGLEDGTPVEMYVDGDRVCLLPYQEACMFCGLPADFGNFRNRALCRSCAESLVLLSETAESGEGETGSVQAPPDRDEIQAAAKDCPA